MHRSKQERVLLILRVAAQTMEDREEEASLSTMTAEVPEHLCRLRCTNNSNVLRLRRVCRVIRRHLIQVLPKWECLQMQEVCRSQEQEDILFILQAVRSQDEVLRSQ